MTSTTFNQELVYLIRDDASGLHKIGITTNWDRRSRELGVGYGSTAIDLVPCDNSKYWEKVLHRYFKDRRLPQSEWFRVTEEEALPMMEWLREKTAPSEIEEEVVEVVKVRPVPVKISNRDKCLWLFIGVSAWLSLLGGAPFLLVMLAEMAFFILYQLFGTYDS